MDRILASKVFITIVEQGSMIKAADTLNMSRSMVTRYLAEMENWAQSRLLHRTTRRLTVTAAGESVLVECYKLQEIEKEVSFAANQSGTAPKGKLRIATSQFFGEHVLASFVSQYLTRYPQVSIDIMVNNHTVDLVGESVDLAIRISNSLDPNIIARKLGELNSLLVASPSYLAEHGAPTSISQLASRNCLTYSYFNNSEWHFDSEQGRQSVRVSGNLNSNDTKLLLQSSLDGLGISMQPKLSALPFVTSGELTAVLTEHKPQTFGVYGIYQSREYMAQALRCFIDELAEYILQKSL